MTEQLQAPRPEATIGSYEADYLLVWANQIDARIQSTDANADVWAWHLSGKKYETCQQIIADYYGKTSERGELAAITPGQIKREYQRREAIEQAKQEGAKTQHKIEAGTYQRPRRMPRHVLERFQSMGMLEDRDPNDYDPR